MRELAASVLATAVSDAVNNTETFSQNVKYEAARWLLSGGFVLWCHVLELDVDAFLDNVRRILIERGWDRETIEGWADREIFYTHGVKPLN